MATTIPENIMGQITNKTFIQGLGDIIEVVQSVAAGKGRSDAAVQWAGNFTTSWVPNIIRSTARGGMENYPERGVWGKGGDRWGRIGRRILQRTEIPGIKDLAGPDLPAVDVWGREATRSFADHPKSSFVYNMLIPMRTSKHDIIVADAVIARWNANHGDESYEGPLPPSRSYSVDGETKYMTDTQYEQFSRLAGQTARRIVEQEFFDEQEPTQEDINAIKTALSDSRSMVLDQLKKEWAGGPPATVKSDEMGDALVEKHIVSKARTLARDIPNMMDVKKYDKNKYKNRGEALAAKRKDLEEEKAKAKEWLKRRKVDSDKIDKTYLKSIAGRDSMERIESADTRSRRMALLRRELKKGE